MELTIKLAFDEETMDVRLVDVKTDKIIQKKERRERCELSDYARWFDEGSVAWTKDSEYNLMFLKYQQNHCCDMLRAKGKLFLNEVYDLLGLPRSKAGQVIGWVYDEKNPIGDIFVDFDIYHERNADFINGCSNKSILDFNIDGNILNLLEID